MDFRQSPSDEHGMMIPDADEQLKAAANEAVRREFPIGVPEAVRQRIGTELRLAERNGLASVILVLKKIADTCRAHGAQYTVLGTAGNAMLNLLLGVTPVNPMPPYAYCPSCGHFEQTDIEQHPTAYDGVSVCPNCGTALIKDGFDLPEEFFYLGSQPRNLTVRTAKAMRPIIYAEMQKLFGPDQIGWENSSPETILIAPHGIAITDSEPAVICRAAHGATRPDAVHLPLYEKSGDPLHTAKPRSVSEWIVMYATQHGSGTWTEEMRELLAQGTPLQDIVTTRESVMRYLLRHGVDRSDAFTLAEAARKGLFVSRPEKYQSLINQYEIPQVYLNQLRHVRYLCPEAQAIEEFIR